jgi:hypothetical protein
VKPAEVRRGSDKVDMYVKEPGRWYYEIAHWRDRMPVDFGFLAGGTNLCPGTTILLPFVTLGDEFGGGLSSRM